MRLNKRYRAAGLFFVAAFLICVLNVSVLLAQTDEGLIIEGESFEKVRIGKTTMNEVTAIYGENYELMSHKDYSYEMIYSLGLSFYACQNDPNREIFDVKIRTPHKARTSNGIVLGESTLSDVFRIYKSTGKRGYSDSDQKGIQFFVDFNYENGGLYKPLIYKKDSTELMIHNQKVIQRIDLVEPSGLRQCDTKFPKIENK